MARQRGDKWQADVRDEGKRYRFTFESRIDAEAWESIAKQAVTQGKPIPEPQGIHFGKSLSDFLRESAGFLWGGTKSEVKLVRNAEFAVEFFGRNKLLSDITSSDIIDYIEHLKELRNSNATINRKVCSFSKLMKHARKRGHIREPLEFPHLKETTGRTRFLSDDEEMRILRRLKHLGYYNEANFAQFLLYTGARPGEALRLEWQDVTNKVTFWETKSGKPRSIPLAEKAQLAIGYARTHKSNKSSRVFHMINYWTFGLAFSKARDYEKLSSDIIPYTLRHTCASRLVQRGIDIRRVKEWLGHSNITITMRYAHLAPDDLNEAASVL